MKIGKISQRAVVYTALGVGVLVVAFPLFWLLSSSLKPGQQAFAYPPALLPEEPSLDNYTILLTGYPFARWVLNSFVVAVTVTGASLVLHSMAGYALARLKFPGRNLLFLGIISTYMLPIYTIIVPRFLIVKSLGWVDTYQGMIIPSIFSAFGIFAFRQFFMGIPRELEEAALIDGASRIRVFVEIVLPLARGIALTLGVILFVVHWDAFIWPLVIARSADLWVAQVGIASFRDPQTTNWGLVLSASVTTVVPGLLLFFALQRFIVQGIRTTGIRG